MKKIIILLIICFSFSMSFSQKGQNVYVLIDKKNDLFIQKNNFYHFFTNQAYLTEFLRRENYNSSNFDSYHKNTKIPEGISKVDYESDCLSAQYFVDNKDAYQVDQSGFEKLGVIGMKDYMARFKSFTKIYFVEKIDKNCFSIKKGIVNYCE